MHKNARLTPLGREQLVRLIESGQTPKAVADAVAGCTASVLMMSAIRVCLHRLSLGVLLLALIAAPSSATRWYSPSEKEPENWQEITIEELKRRNIDPRQIESMHIEARLETRRSSKMLRGYEAWVRLKQCEKGHIIVQLSRQGTVQGAYAFEGCDPAVFKE